MLFVVLVVIGWLMWFVCYVVCFFFFIFLSQCFFFVKNLLNFFFGLLLFCCCFFYKSMSGKKVLFLLLTTTSGDNQRSVSNICSDLVIVSSFKHVSKNSSIVMTPSWFKSNFLNTFSTCSRAFRSSSV